MNEPSGLAPEVVTIRDLHIRFNLGREKKRRCFVRRRKNAACGTRYQSLYPSGETFSIVGESGCGKSTVARALAGLYQPASGEINYAWRSPQMAGTVGQNGTQMIFQDPYASLNPRWRIGRSLAEPLVLAKKVVPRARLGNTAATC